MTSDTKRPTVDLEMNARDVEETAAHLRDLHVVEWEDLGLAAFALGFAIAATGLWPPLAVPVFLGGLTVGALGIRALWRRWDLVDRLAGEPDAYVIPEILAYASREATMDSRGSMATTIRSIVSGAGEPNESRIAAVAEELEGLAEELEDVTCELDPASAVACSRLLHGVRSALSDESVPVDELRARIRHIRTGFTARLLAAGGVREVRIP